MIMKLAIKSPDTLRRRAKKKMDKWKREKKKAEAKRKIRLTQQVEFHSNHEAVVIFTVEYTLSFNSSKDALLKILKEKEFDIYSALKATDLLDQFLEAVAKRLDDVKNARSTIQYERRCSFREIMSELIKIDKEPPKLKQEETSDFSEKFFDAARKGDLAKVEEFIRKKVDVNESDQANITALMYASYNGHLDVVRLLIRHGADVHRQDVRGMTALMNAVMKSYNYVVADLLQKGADKSVNTRNNAGQTALDFAERAYENFKERDPIKANQCHEIILRLKTSGAS